MAQQPPTRRPNNQQGIVNWLYQPHPELAGNAIAAVHGAGDAFTLGLADRGSALKAAILGRRRGESFASAYNRQMAVERRQDQYEARHYGAARTGGQIAGTIGQVLLLGPMEGAVAGGARIGQVTRMIAREKAALGAFGAGAGVSGQAVSDVANKRLSSPGDYAGAAVGGAVEGLVSVYGLGSRAGAAGGAATSLAQDVANGRRPSVERAQQAAGEAAVMGGALGALGRAASNSLSAQDKGKLGELMSRPRTWVRGDRTLPIGKKAKHLTKSWTYPDHWLAGDKFVESKFGRGVDDLSGAQKRAFRELREKNQKALYPKYRVDHWLPQDIGVGLAALMAPQRYLNADEPWPPPAAAD